METSRPTSTQEDAIVPHTSTIGTPPGVWGDYQTTTDKSLFQLIDYVVFGAMLLVSALIGVFFAIKNRRNSVLTSEAYLMASRKMTYGPVSLSLIASFMSSVTILGVPAEYYIYGTMFSWFGVVYLLLPILVGFVFMPVFYDLGINSTYEYLEKRFNKPIRLVTTFMYLVLTILYGGIVVYGPALALNEVTGFDMWIAILTTGLVCIFYTTLGGLKAVIWTDVFQSVVMITGFIAVIIQGSINLGGFSNIWKAAEEGGRIDFIHFEVDPRYRLTFWSIFFGGTILWLGIYGVNQTQVQRYICCKSKRDAQIALAWNSVGLVVILILAGMTGLTMYATYRNCDPLNSGKVNRSDQLFPYIVMDTLGHLPGIPGLFVAGVYSSSLSTISSAINAMACVTLEDFVKPYTRWRTTSYTSLSRFLVIGFGASLILVAYIASKVGGLIRMAYSIHGIISGPIVGLFTLGIMFPFVNELGAFIGVIFGWGTTIWMFIGSVIYPVPSEYKRALARSIDECDGAIPTMGSGANLSDANVYFTESESVSHSISYSSATISSSSVLDEVNKRPPIADFYDISYFYFAAVGCLVTIILGIAISLLTGLTKKHPPSNELLCPMFHSKRDDGKPPLERSTSWFSPTALANAQRIVRQDSDVSFKQTPELEPLQRSPDVIASLSGNSFIPEKESSF